MKLKKIILLPFMLLILTSCNEKKVDRDIATTRVIAAIEKTLTDPITSLNVLISGELNQTLNVYGENDEVLKESTAKMTGQVTYTGNNLDRENGAFIVKALGTYTAYDGEKKLMDYDFDNKLYYTDGVAYHDFTTSAFNDYVNETRTLSGKQKQEVEIYTGIARLPNIEEELPFAFRDLKDILSAVETVTASGRMNILTVKYSLKNSDIVEIAKVLYAEELAAMTAEDQAAALTKLAEIVNDEYLIHQGDLIIEVKNGYIRNVSLIVDLDTMGYMYVYNDDIERFEMHPSVWKTKGAIDVSLQINEKVELAFPSFTDFVLVDDLMAIF